MIDDIGLSGSFAAKFFHSPRCPRLSFEQGHRRLEHGRVLHPDRFHVEQRPHRPTDIVIGPGVVDVEILSVQHHVRHPGIRLVHPDDEAPRGELVLPGFERGICPMDFHALQLEQSQQAGRLPRPRVVTRKHVGCRPFRPRLGHRPLALQPEILHEPGRLCGHGVHADEECALLQVHVVPDRPESPG